MILQEQKVVGPFSCNTILLLCSETYEAVMVDPGDEPESLKKWLEDLESKFQKKITLRYFLHTHAHLDHIGATKSLKQSFPDAKICLHQKDEFLYQMLKKQGEMFGFTYEDPHPVEKWISDEEEIQVGKEKITVLHTPGHSPGGCCYKISNRVMSGDTLFHRSIGRTDLWGGDFDLLKNSIKDRLYTLDDDTLVFPGHGPKTKMGEEKRSNPFVQK